MKYPKKLSVLVGLLACSVAQMIVHFITIPDFAAGFLNGAGIGIMLLALIKQKHPAVQ